MGGHSRSRSRHRGRRDAEQPRRSEATPNAKSGLQKAERPRRSEATPDAKSGLQKAKEAVEKEREKARLKKLEREQAQKIKAGQRDVGKQERRKQDEDSLALIGRVAPASTDTPAGAGGEEATSARNRRARQPRVLAPPPAQSPGNAGGPVLHEVLIRKLFALMDRSSKGQVSRRDVLVSLRKQPSVRRLFGLPDGNAEGGGAILEARLLAIQDAFEAGSGLGELEAAFGAMRLPDGAGQTFGFDAFLAACLATGPLHSGAEAAAAVLPREHCTGVTFVATTAWREVPDGAACPGGLEYKMDMETGRTLARLPPKAKRVGRP